MRGKKRKEKKSYTPEEIIKIKKKKKNKKC